VGDDYYLKNELHIFIQNLKELIKSKWVYINYIKYIITPILLYKFWNFLETIIPGLAINVFIIYIIPFIIKNF
jgi:RsiW-degrading membrane proteinase PrsW (M82 family)